MDMLSVPWLEKLLAITAFFTTCEVHQNESKNERNKFCLDCNDNPFCGSCIESCHKDHRVIQTRRSSYNEVVKTTQIYKLVDILGIQTYVINSFTVVFINKRAHPQPKRYKVGKIGCSSDYLCKICNRNLLDSTYFCSLACKFAYVKKNGGFFTSAKEMEEMERLLEKAIKVSPPKEKAKKSREQDQKRKVEEAEINEENEEGEDEEEEEEEEKMEEKEEGDDDKDSMLHVTCPLTSLRNPNSRRKIIPQRAPFF